MADTKLTAVIQLADKLSKPLKGVNTKLQNMQKPIKGLQGQFRRLDRMSGFKNLRQGLGNVAGQMSKLGLIGAGGIGAMVAAVSKLSQSGDKIIKTASNFDISTKKLQEYYFIAERSGVTQEVVNKTMQAFTKRLAEARNGTGELYSLLKDVNPEFLNQLLAIKDNGEAYDMLVTKMAQLPDQQRQILLGDKAFSEAGRELVKVTSQGAAAIEEMRQEAHKYGAVIDEDILRQSADFQDKMTNLGSVIKNLAMAFGSEMMPAIQGIVRSMTEWGAQNRELIKQKLTDVAESIASGIRKLGENLPGIIERVSSFVDRIGGMKTVLIAAGLIITGPLLSAIVGLIGPLTMVATTVTTLVVPAIAAIGKALLLNPIGLAATAIAGAAYLIYKNWEPIKEFFSNLWGSITESFEAGMEKIRPIIESLKNAAKTLAAPVKKLFEFGGNAADAVTGAAGDAVDGVKGFFGFGDEQQARESLLPKNQRTQVGGQVSIKIDSEGRPKVQQVRSDNPSVGIDVDAGMSLVGAM